MATADNQTGQGETWAPRPKRDGQKVPVSGLDSHHHSSFTSKFVDDLDLKQFRVSSHLPKDDLASVTYTSP